MKFLKSISFIIVFLMISVVTYADFSFDTVENNTFLFAENNAFRFNVTAHFPSEAIAYFGILLNDVNTFPLGDTEFDNDTSVLLSLHSGKHRYAPIVEFVNGTILEGAWVYFTVVELSHDSIQKNDYLFQEIKQYHINVSVNIPAEEIVYFGILLNDESFPLGDTEFNNKTSVLVSLPVGNHKYAPIIELVDGTIIEGPFVPFTISGFFINSVQNNQFLFSTNNYFKINISVNYPSEDIIFLGILLNDENSFPLGDTEFVNKTSIHLALEPGTYRYAPIIELVNGKIIVGDWVYFTTITFNQESVDNGSFINTTQLLLNKTIVVPKEEVIFFGLLLNDEVFPLGEDGSQNVTSILLNLPEGQHKYAPIVEFTNGQILQGSWIYFTVDITPPVLTIIGFNETINQNSVYNDKGAVAFDAISGDVTNRIVVNNTVNTSVLGTYVIIYTVTDDAGNTAQKNRIVIVQAAPTQTTTGGNGITIPSRSSATCTTQWTCSEWSTCENGIQTRTCDYPTNFCMPVISRPSEVQTCTIQQETTPTEEQTDVEDTGLVVTSPTEIQTTQTTTTEQQTIPEITGFAIANPTTLAGMIIIVFVVLFALVLLIIKKRS